MTEKQLRAKAHEAMDKYLDAGGTADLVIMSRADLERNAPKQTTTNNADDPMNNNNHSSGGGLETPDTAQVRGNQVGKNSELGLPFGKMRTIKIAFDVDGTLRSNKTETTKAPNVNIVRLFRILDTFKNVELYVWSGGGGQYAFQYANEIGLPVKQSHCISKINAPQMDIAIDDIQDTAIAPINLIVREK